jgi:hypothetical protein
MRQKNDRRDHVSRINDAREKTKKYKQKQLTVIFM